MLLIASTMTQRSFLPPVIDLQQALESESDGGSGQGSISRRQFIKISGGATVATLVAFNLAKRAEAATVIPGSSGISSSTYTPSVPIPCTKTKCWLEPTKWGDFITNPSPAVGDWFIELTWWLTGPVSGQTAPIPTPLPFLLGAEVKVKKCEYNFLGAPHVVTVDHIPSTVVNQSAACDAVDCIVHFSPPNSDALVFSSSGATVMKLKLRRGVVTQIEVIYTAGTGTPPTGFTIGEVVPVTGLKWAFDCIR
jgi:hypothetical protein